MTRMELVRRYGLFTGGLFLEGLGIALAKESGLGVSPVSSIANVVSCEITRISLGTWLFIWNCLLLLMQLVILGRRFRPLQLLQLPLSVLFGCFTDIGLALAHRIPLGSYAGQSAMLLAGILFLALGIELTVIANVVLNSGEGFVKAVSDRTGFSFGNVKVATDISFVTIAVVLSLVLFHGSIVGTREGTIISACLTGFAVRLWARLIERPVEAVFALSPVRR